MATDTPVDTRLRSAEFESIAKAFILASFIANETPVNLPEGPALVKEVKKLGTRRYKVTCELIAK